MHTVNALVAALSVLGAALLAALPLGLGSEYRFLLPQVVYMVIHFWTVRYPVVLPEWTVFCAGLLLDVLTGGPLGFWALIYLVGQAIARQQSVLAANGRVVRWALLAAAVIVLTLLEWVFASLYFLEWVDWQPFASGALTAILIYPFIAAALALLDARALSQIALGRGGGA
jgi:rod shape-determining protein MreD